MYQLTTPLIVIHTDIDLTGMDDVELTIKDTFGTTLCFHKSNLTISADTVEITLTQQQTQQLKTGIIKMQLRYINGGSVPEPSNVMETMLKSILSQGGAAVMFHATFVEENSEFQARLVHEQVDEITAEGTRQKEIVETAGAGQVSAVTDAGETQVQTIITEGTTQTNTIRAYCEEQQTIINQKVSSANGAKDDAVTAQGRAEAAQQVAETSAQTASQRAAEAAEHDILTQTAFTDAQQAQARKNINAEKSKGVYELIETITLTGDTTSVVRTQEPDGTPYAFRAIGVVVQAEVGSANSGINVLGNYESTRLQSGFINGAINDSIKKYGYAQIYPDWGVWAGIGSTAVNGFAWVVTQMTGYSPAQAFSVKESENPYCTQVTLQPNVSGATIPTGTIIQIYGVRA